MTSTPTPAGGGTVGRYLPNVLREIIGVAPDTEPALRSVLSSADFSAPENMGMWWRRASNILNDKFPDHPKREKIAAIFNGPTPHPTPPSVPEVSAKAAFKAAFEVDIDAPHGSYWAQLWEGFEKGFAAAQQRQREGDAEKLRLVHGMGLRFAMMKSSDKPEPYLVVTWTEDSDHERMFREWSHSIGWEQKLTASETARDELQREVAALKLALSQAHNVACNHSHQPIGGPGCICRPVSRHDDDRQMAALSAARCHVAVLREALERIVSDTVELFEDGVEADLGEMGVTTIPTAYKQGVEDGMKRLQDDAKADLATFPADLSQLVAVERKNVEWQPMETAPRDGQWVVLLFQDGAKYVAGFESAGWINSDCDELNIDRATHWLPLPTAHAAKGGGL